MAKITTRPSVNLELTFTINETEARALDALAGYGDDAFIQHFYEKLGKAYMEDHEAGLRCFLKDIRAFVPSALRRVDDARKAFNAPPEQAKA